MRRKIIFSMALCLALLEFQIPNAQQALLNGCSSAGNVVQPVWFNCDYPETSAVDVNLHYRTQSGNSFTLLSMSPVDQLPYYEYTYQASVSFPISPGILEYYFSASQDTIITTQSPKNTNNQFPPSLYKYAPFISDPRGDMAGGSAGNWLDLTDNGMSYSDTRIYCYLKNVAGTWPLSQLFTYYAYTSGFMITSGSDSSFYAMVYANIPLMLSSGLFILNRADSSYTRIGDISYNISGGALNMACNLSDLAAAPGWPGWPPPEGYIIPMSATLTASLSNQMVNDYTYPAIFQPTTQYLDFNSNNSPALSAFQIQVDSGVGITSDVVYSDPNNNLPVTRKFHFDSNSYDFNSYDHTYSDSSAFETALGWPEGGGWHRYYCEFSDGVDTVETPADSFHVGLSGCVYYTGDANGSNSFNGLDVTYSVSYFKGGNPPPYSCECTPGHVWYVAGDVNGSCSFNGLDVSYMVSYLKGGPSLYPCADCPPFSLIRPIPGVLPSIESISNNPGQLVKKPNSLISINKFLLLKLFH